MLDDVTISYSTATRTTPPVISAVAAAVGSGGNTATITWTTDEPADSQVAYGTDPNSLMLAASDGSLVTSHTVTLTGLTPAMPYYYPCHFHRCREQFGDLAGQSRGSRQFLHRGHNAARYLRRDRDGRIREYSHDHMDNR